MKTIASGPIKRETLRSRVVQVIRDAILSGKLQPGDRIVELTLAESLGIGTTAVREALFELESTGFVTRVANKGTFVTRLGQTDIEQIFRVRREMEGFAVHLLQSQTDRAPLTELYAYVEKMREAARARNLREFYAADLEFHRTIWRLTGNRYLERALDSLVAPLFAFFTITNQRASTMDLLASAECHAAIIRGLEQGDDARGCMEEQMQFFATLNNNQPLVPQEA